MSTYEIRRSGEVICSSSIFNCGYPKEILKDMERSGMRLYCDGERGEHRRGRIQRPERVAAVGR